MNTSKKKLTAILAVVIVTVLALTLFWEIPNINSTYSIEKSVQDKTISALRDIVGLNLTDYNVNFSVHDIPFAQYNGSKVEDVACNLQSNQSNNQIVARFINGTLAHIGLSSLKGSYTNQLPIDPLEASKVLLGRLEKYYSEPTYLKPMIDALGSPTNVNSFNHTIDNIKRQVVVHTEFIQVNQTFNYTSTYTSVSFMYVFGDVLDSPKSIVFSFRDGSLVAFGNSWELYQIGSQTINVSREQAINTAIEQGNNATTNGLKLRNQDIRADLSLRQREPFVLYPFWFVDLPLASQSQPSSNDQTFVHAFTEWQVGIWADTGQIEYSHPA
jgi:hypothetical protein